MSKKKKNGDWRCSSEKKFFHENALCRYGLQCKIAQDSSFSEADTDAVNKLYVKQRVKILTNQQKESDKRLTLFEKDERCKLNIINEFQRAIIKTELKTTMNNNER